MEQLSLLFNEAEAYAKVEPPEKTEVAAHTSQKRSGSIEEILPDNVPVEVVEHRLAEEERLCAACDTIMQEIGKEVRRTLVIVPAQVKIREDWYFNYACQTCKAEALETPVLKTQKDKPVIPGSNSPHHDPEIRDGLPSLPAGAGTEPKWSDAVPPDHVQLDLKSIRGLAEACV